MRKYNLEKENVKKSICDNCKINNLNLLDNYMLTPNKICPSPNNKYLFLFINNEKNNLICYLRNKNLEIAKNLANGDNLDIRYLSCYFHKEEPLFFVFSFD